MRLRFGLFLFTLGMLYLLAHVIAYVARALQAIGGAL